MAGHQFEHRRESADTSPGTAFLFSVIWQTSQIFSILEPAGLPASGPTAPNGCPCPR